MKEIRVAKDFNYKGKIYEKGDIIEEKLPQDIINKLNEKGFIEPLSIKDLIEYEEAKPQKNKEVK